MEPLVLIAGIILVPLVLMTVLRVNAAVVFMSLCLGGVLVQFAGNDASQFVNLFHGNQSVSKDTAALALIVLPAAFTMFVMVKTVHGHFRLILNILPAASVGVLALLLAQPYLAPGLRHALTETKEWHNVRQLQGLFISVSAVISLLFLWLQRPSQHGRHEEGKKHGHH